jgi:citrate lyase subunit beta/citryl-CoA lyase
LDLDGMRQEAMLARANGFSGKACIHPDQIPIARDVFTPSARTLTEMRRLVATADEAARAGSGVTVLDGRMVDRPVVDRARRVLEMAEATDRAAQERRTHKESNP